MQKFRVECRPVMLLISVRFIASIVHDASVTRHNKLRDRVETCLYVGLHYFDLLWICSVSVSVSVYLIPFEQLHDTNTNKNMNGKGLKGTIVL